MLVELLHEYNQSLHVPAGFVEKATASSNTIFLKIVLDHGPELLMSEKAIRNVITGYI